MSDVEEQVVAGIHKMLSKLSDEKNQKRFKKWNKTVAFSFKELNKTWSITLTAGLPGELLEGEIDKFKKYDILLMTDPKTWFGIINKEVKAMAVFQSGELKIKGKMTDLLKLRKVL
ncbi:MAG: SCP2 sterol-binding domain-containing protein [Candidatus Hodarchaeales archaeon]|jgi:putative sterol carrier protein